MFFSPRSSIRTRRTRLLLERLEDRTVPTLLGQQLFPADNPWSEPITNAPVAVNSAAVINNIISQSGGDGRLHPDFGQDYGDGRDLYGIPYNVVHGNGVAKVQVVIDGDAGESDVASVPIPSNVVIEGDFQNGPNVGVDNRGDSHLLIWDEDNNVAYEFYRASRPSENSDGRWHADQETVWDMNTDTFRTLGWTSADAAGLSLLAGLARPDEALPVAQGGQGAIDHPIRMTLQNSIILDQFIYPASHVANPGNANPAVQPPMGARFRLKAGVDISALDPESRVIAQAMKDYGLIVADNGSNFYISGASYAVNGNNQIASTWDDNDIQDTVHGLKSLRFSDFELVDLTPVVAGLSVHGGPVGATVTVTGENFSGAAGHLQVFFGATAATSVTVIDDGHVVASAPPGTGTVDVRVQSGATTAPDGQNIKSTIFGYGTSATSSSDLFTYGVNHPPTVATAAVATPNPLTGATAALSVLGADDGGEGNLTYTWTAAGPAAVAFSANGGNAAKSAVATFTQSGVYTLTATVLDAGGLTVTSAVNVRVTLPATAVYADFTGYGLNRWTSAGGWQRLNPVDPVGFVAGSDGSLYVNFGVYGLYRWTSAGGWLQLNTVQPEGLAGGPNGSLYVDYGVYGLYQWAAAGGWRLLNSGNPAGMAAAPDGSLYVDFGGRGLYRWTGAGGWQLLNAVDPHAFAAGPDGSLYVDYGVYGLYRWTSAGGWQLLKNASPSSMAVAPDGFLYADFGGQGLWRWSAAGGWQLLNAVDPNGFTAGPDGSLYVEYGAYGFYRWTSVGGWQLLNAISPSRVAAGPAL